MARSVPSNAKKKPPVPSDSHDEIGDWIRHAMPDLQPIVRYLDSLVRRTVPGLEYAVKWKKAYYGTPDHGWIIEMVAYDVSVNLVFFAGARFDDPPPLGEGSRYVKIRTLEEAKDPQVRAWIQQAAATPGWT